MNSFIKSMMLGVVLLAGINVSCTAGENSRNSGVEFEHQEGVFLAGIGGVGFEPLEDVSDNRQKFKEGLIKKRKELLDKREEYESEIICMEDSLNSSQMVISEKVDFIKNPPVVEVLEGAIRTKFAVEDYLQTTKEVILLYEDRIEVINAEVSEIDEEIARLENLVADR